MTRKNQRSCFATAFGAFFALIGIVALVLIGREFFQAAKIKGWEKVPVVIDSLEVSFPEKKPQSSGHHEIYEFIGSYTYKVDGKSYQSTKIQRQAYTSSSYHELALKRRGLIHDEHGHALVNPNDPSDSVLLAESLSMGLLLFFPIPFLVIGLAVMAAGLGWYPTSMGTTASYKSSSQNDSKSGCLLLLFGSVFAAAGLGVGYGLFLGPWLHQRNASDWVETPCQIQWSRVCSHEGDDSTTYSVEVFYEYEYDNETHHSNRYSCIQFFERTWPKIENRQAVSCRL